MLIATTGHRFFVAQRVATTVQLIITIRLTMFIVIVLLSAFAYAAALQGNHLLDHC